jgi:hypothetical protein
MLSVTNVEAVEVGNEMLLGCAIIEANHLLIGKGSASLGGVYWLSFLAF